MAAGEGHATEIVDPWPAAVGEIAAGGGGIPVVRRANGRHIGIEAIIDKHHASRLLAVETGADTLFMLTDVDGIYLGWGTAQQKRLGRTTPEELKRHSFASGSMAPKVEAARVFIVAGGKRAGIVRLEDAPGLLEGKAGTVAMAQS